MRTLYRAARVYSGDPAPPGPAAEALLVDDNLVTWVGPWAAGRSQLPGGPVDAVVELPGALVAPAFVDAHVHVTETGLALDGVDLGAARSVAEVLGLVEAASRARRGRPVLGHGWDERRLAERRPPTRVELDREAEGGSVYLSRVDVHSAVVSTALATASGAIGLDGWDDAGRVERDAHHAVRAATRSGLRPAAVRDVQRLALGAAAAGGIAAVHEMSAPHIASAADLAGLLALAADRGERVPHVVAYRGQLVSGLDEARELLAGLPGPLAGLAGDLCADGSVGSRTAAFRAPYTDAPHTGGHLYLEVGQIRDHVVACTRAGVQAGFHVIGDAAVDAVLCGVRRAAERVGIAAVRAARHRLEHLEAIGAGQVTEVADLGLTASVQPAFDALWGGATGMYAERLGASRALAMNPFRPLLAAGAQLALGSDAPVTPFDPWGAVRAATGHHVSGHRLGTAEAFAAHTRGGWSAAGPPARSRAGTLTAGAPATFAVWSLEHGDPLAEPATGGPDERPRPRCLLTVLDGRVLHDPAALAGTRGGAPG
jgi:predicted amidohydrolase YtcJ